MTNKEKGDANLFKRLSVFVMVRIYNLFKPVKQEKKTFEDKFEEEIYEKSLKRSDINEHLLTIYRESVETCPKLIVELGVRGGVSTFVFERVAKKCNSTLVSVDIEDCSDISDWENWHFVQKDDIEFAKEFKDWCKERNIAPEIDILFIDTSHLYQHTKDEIKHWFPYLSKNAKVIFHDTNMGFLYKRKDGSYGNGWDNKRGVIRAIEDFCEKKFNEKKEFTDKCKGFEIKHYPYCSGLTIFTKKSI